MKKYLSILALAALTACSNEEDFSRNPNEIRLTSAVSFMTRTTSPDLQNTQIAAGQKVSVTIRNADSPHDNIPWLSDGNGGLDDQDNSVCWGYGDVSVYAFHPYSENVYVDPENDEHYFQFIVKEDQSSDEGYLDSDLLWATATSKKRSDAIPLNFVHKLSKINIELVSTGGVDLSNATISICNVERGIAFKPFTGDFAEYNEGGIMTSDNGNIIAATNSTKATAIIVPQTFWRNRFVKIEANGKVYYYEIKNEKVFESGKQYTFQLGIGSDEDVTLQSANIRAWDTPETIEGTFAEPKTNVKLNLETSELKHTGKLNADDIDILRRMINEGNLTILDLSEAEIEKGSNVDILKFEGCSKLQSITLPESLTDLPWRAFADIDALESVTIYVDNLTSAGNELFEGSQSLSTVTLVSVTEKTDAMLSMENGVLYRKKSIGWDNNNREYIYGKYATWCSPKTTGTLTFPEDLHGVDSHAFKNRNLTSVVFPSGIKEIGYYSFAGVALERVTCKSTTPPNLNGSWAGNRYNSEEYKIASNTVLYVPKESVDAYKAQTDENEWPNHFEVIQEITE